ncbi:S-layer protein [Levilactobacillus angrenensis]|uniref:S-layer protein n=1 Tax=Levilactobacillus angrenensis TaxID=2486020 RepID=A0ABW1UAL7_9LACO
MGLAALSFVSVAAVSTNASAKSYAKAGAYTTLKAAATDRNVEATGTNALYTKPGTVKGAKIVASKKVMGELATSKKSANYFRAYGQKVTNRGSVYYRVVTMDGKYRGYVYGGKTEGTFAAGVKSAKTTTDQTKPTQTTGYYLKNTAKNTLWTAPKYTQYKAKKVSLYNASASDTFTVDQAATKTREGSLYYHVTDDNDNSISGWIYAGKGYDATITDNSKQDLGGLSLSQSDQAATVNNSVTVNYVDSATKKSVGTATWITSAKNTKQNDQVGATTTNAAGTTLDNFAKAKANVPANYQVDTSSTAVTTPAVAGDSLYGGTYTVPVTQTATSKLTLKVQTVTDPDTLSLDPAPAADFKGAAIGDILNKTNAVIPALSNDDLTGATSAVMNDTTAFTSLFADKGTLATIQGTKTYTDSAKNTYHYEYDADTNATPTLNAGTKFGQTYTVAYTAKLVAGPATASNTNSNTNTDYLG